MSSAPAIPFIELSPELYPVIIKQLPLLCRPSTLLSLALTCHRLHDIICPQLLYNDVRLVGEAQALPTLNALITKAELVTEEDIQKQGNPSLSHSIHHLCIESSIITPIRSPYSINALQKLISLDGLRNLTALTLHIFGQLELDGTEGSDPSDDYLQLPSSFCADLKTKCPNLKAINLSYFTQVFENEWIEPDIFSVKRLTSIRIEGYLLNYPLPNINLSQLPPNLHTLELRLRDSFRGKEIDASGLLGCVIPNLRTLILNKFIVSDPSTTIEFWKAHPCIERLELGREVQGSWFNDFQLGMLPNLRYLKCKINHALALMPYVSTSLIRLCLWETYNAQAPYLLRAVAQNGILPALRSLGIERDSGNSPKPREGHRWREDDNGNVSEADAKRPTRQYDGNYILSLSKAAPNLEELELKGTLDDTIESLTASLSRFLKLQRIVLSAGNNVGNKSFFESSLFWKDYDESDNSEAAGEYHGKYAPETFEEAVRDLADGCRTLDVVTMSDSFGELLIGHGLSAKIVRECDGGAVKELRRNRPWGNIVGKEEEW